MNEITQNISTQDKWIHIESAIGKGYEAHHTLPQKYREEFENLGINIDEPGNVIWRSTENHRRNGNQLLKEWDSFMSNPQNRNKESILKF